MCSRTCQKHGLKARGFPPDGKNKGGDVGYWVPRLRALALSQRTCCLESLSRSWRGFGTLATPGRARTDRSDCTDPGRAARGAAPKKEGFSPRVSWAYGITFGGCLFFPMRPENKGDRTGAARGATPGLKTKIRPDDSLDPQTTP